jgi:tetratricopeptide (TPR) repeat protein
LSPSPRGIKRMSLTNVSVQGHGSQCDSRSFERQEIARRRSRRLALFAIPVLMLLCSRSFAFSFIPTPEEWATWPPYCRAVYATVDYLNTRAIAEQVSPAEIEHWRSTLGTSFLGLHHYCAAIAEYNQAMTSQTEQEKHFHLSEASNDALFCYARIGAHDPLAPEITSLYAQVQFEMGHAEEAKRVLTEAIQANPIADRPYLVLASMLRRSSKTPEAMKLLEQGNSATNFNSAEINYTLGLMYAEQRSYGPARECAKRAYALGYPLPGLKKRLEKAGEWHPESP